MPAISGNCPNDLLFDTVDPRGYRVVLSSNRYFGHIISSDMGHQAHPEFSPDEIKQTVECPVAIYGSTRPDADVYFGKTSTQYPELYLKVAVAKYTDCGDVQTAFLTRSISGGIKEDCLKYASFDNRL